MAEKTPTPIRTELFSFATFKSPQLIDVERKRVFFVVHPDPSKSHFIKGLDEQDLPVARQILRQRQKDFKALRRRDDVAHLNFAMYQFSQRLYEERTRDWTVAELNAIRGKLEPLPMGALVTLWDNLFREALGGKNAPLRQACIQMLVADHFVRVFSSEAFESRALELIKAPKGPDETSDDARISTFAKRVARAKVVMPRAFSMGAMRKADEGEGGKQGQQKKGGRDISQYEVERETTRRRRPDPAAIDQLHQDHTAGVTGERIKSLQRTKKELQAVSRSDEVTRSDVSSFARLEEKAPGTFSATTRKLIAHRKARGVNLGRVQNMLDQRIAKEERRKALAEQRQRPGVGASARSPVAVDTFIVTHELAVDDESRDMHLTLQLADEDAFVRKAAITLTTGDGQVYQSSEVEELPTLQRRQVSVDLFPGQVIDFGRARSYQIEGTLELDDGTELELSAETTLAKDRVGGVALRKVMPGGRDVLPDHDIQVFDKDPQTDAKGRLFGVNNVGVAVFHKVEQEVCCYVPGEVSHIENILAREYKERQTRSLTSTETTTEDTTAWEAENQRDTSTAMRNELQSEVAAVLNRETNVGTNASTGVTGSVAGQEFRADAAFDFGYSNGSTASNTDARTYAEDVTRAATERVLQKTTVKRTSKMLSEFEETNRHGFDNREGTEHVTGVYRWLDIIYRNRLINYGKHLMVEFLIPEPAVFYLKALNRANKPTDEGPIDETSKPQPPKTLEAQGIYSSADILREENPEDSKTEGKDYRTLEEQFDAVLEDPPFADSELSSVDFAAPSLPNGKPDDSGKLKSKTFSIQVPHGFRLSIADLTVKFLYHYTGSEHKTFMRASMGGRVKLRDKNTKASVGGQGHPLQKTDSDNRADWEWTDMNMTWVYSGQLEGEVKLKVEMKNVHDYNISGDLTFEMLEAEFVGWQERCYSTLRTAYQRQLENYERELAAWEAARAQEAAAAANEEEEIQYGASPAQNRLTEQQELKRIAIDMLTRPFGIDFGVDFVKPGPCKVPIVDQSKEWEEYASHVKFFEQAFLWPTMAYLFYPYYWGDRCDWEEKMLLDVPSDPLFVKFLQSGMARVVVPVRRGFEDAVTYFLNTGEIWNGGDLVLDTDDDLYLSVADELQETKGMVEDEWPTRLPTTLTIVQGDSVYLRDEGLPCCERIGDKDVQTLLEGSQNILERDKSA
ncbi:hypothetical protein [Hydrogenophaga sp. 5NK40-0174]|uniref:hypothetical protein n=1 Tax=Hydrogenophaga sp. 5NK40-0174 TaxID=3127649 RepID=UPI0031056731